MAAACPGRDGCRAEWPMYFSAQAAPRWCGQASRQGWKKASALIGRPALWHNPAMRSSGACGANSPRTQFEWANAREDATDDDRLDAVLGLNRLSVESALSLGVLLVAHGQHRLEASDLSYSIARDVYRSLNVNSESESTIVDLGCGYGRVGFFGAVLWGQKYHGIEILAERVGEARRVQRQLCLDSLRFEVGNIVTCAWPDSAYYLMLNSVLPRYLPEVIERFRQIAATRSITIVSVSTANEQFRRQHWLYEVIPTNPSAALPVCLRLFKSERA